MGSSSCIRRRHRVLASYKCKHERKRRHRQFMRAKPTRNSYRHRLKGILQNVGKDHFYINYKKGWYSTLEEELTRNWVTEQGREKPKIQLSNHAKFLVDTFLFRKVHLGLGRVDERSAQTRQQGRSFVRGSKGIIHVGCGLPDADFIQLYGSLSSSSLRFLKPFVLASFSLVQTIDRSQFIFFAGKVVTQLG